MSIDRTNSDAVPRSVMALQTTVEKKKWELEWHSHRKAQLLFNVRGIINCEIEEGLWIVPPQCAVWIPGGLRHSVRGAGAAECYCLFVEPDASLDLRATCCTLAVSPLLRELICRAAAMPKLYAVDGPHSRLVATLLDELVAAPVEDLHLPMPRDVRLRRLAEMLLANPKDKSSLTGWARRIGMSQRNLTRLLLQEIGLTFGRWRRQLHVILSLQRLAKGESVQKISLDLGYENASGFVTMFRKAVGKPPARYMAELNEVPGSVSKRAKLRAIVLPERM